MDIIKSIFRFFGARVFASISSFVGLALFANELGAYDLGVFFLFQAVLSILMLPANFGLRGALEKRVSEGNNPSELLSTTALLKILPLSLICLLIILFQGKLNDYVGGEIAFVLALALIIEECYQLAVQLLNAELRVDQAANLLVVRQVVWLIGGIVAVWYFNLRGIGLIYSLVAGSFCGLLLGIYLKETSLGYPTLKSAERLFSYAKFDVITGAGATLYSWLDVVVIGLILTQTEVGAYETAWKVSAMTVMFGIAIRTALFPQVSAWSTEEKENRISGTLREMIIASLFFVLPSLAGVILLNREILSLVFGDEFVIASTVLVILVLHRVFQGINQTVGRTLQAIDKIKEAAYAMIVGGVLNVLLNFTLIPEIGIVGAAIATLVSYASMTLLRTHFLTQEITVQFPLREVSWCAVASTVMGGVIWIITSNYEITNLVELCSVISLGAMIYFGVIVLSPRFRNKIRTTSQQFLA